MTSTTQSPSDNFYLHVNSKWLNDPANKIPAEYPKWGGFIKLHDNTLKEQIKLVQTLKNKTDKTEEEMKISAIWEASVTRFNSWRNKSADYNPIIQELQTLESYIPSDTTPQDLINNIAKYYYYTQVNGISNVFDFDKGSDLTNSNNVVLDFSVSGLSLPSREYYTEDNFKEKREMFKQHLQNIANLLNTDLGSDFVQNVFDFENELAKYTMKREQSRNYSEYYTNTTLTNLYKNINSLTSLPEKQNNYVESERDFKLNDLQLKSTAEFFEMVYNLFDFRNVMQNNSNKYFNNVDNPPNIEHVTVFDGDAVRRVVTMILTPENLVKYKSYLQYKIISAFKAFCTEEMDNEFFDFYSRKLSGQAEKLSEDKRSIQTVNGYAGEMMGKVYVDNFFPEKYKKDISQMIQEMIEVMKDSINKNDWLTTPTKEKALIKLNKFNVKIGYPDVWKDYSKFDIQTGDTLYDIVKKAKKWSLYVEFYDKLNSVLDRNEWHMTPQTVNAYFSPSQNEIVFPAAILQPPFYCKTNDDIDFDITDEVKMTDMKYDFTKAVNFGGICAVIAHEITHGYDDKGRKFDGNGNLQEWWTEEDAKLFKEKTELMANQASQYKFVDSDDNKEYKLNPQLTMGENLADIGGISLALQAMNKQLQKNNVPPQIVKANQRVLFKSFANIWKQNTKKDYMINQMTTDPHSPSEFRANLVKNMNEFYDVFNVTENDNMYISPDKRIRMW
ncbi:peptidase M13 [Klosneuvirus KNV1]|uniref:Peptidase M13 n=1 Tax=Klosneuvirus KNV1 TaxID=1977640 RepID=A0A1V0SHG2_9VIRU|nr:peptidase M13 [Klosneuvirus KNV1]